MQSWVQHFELAIDKIFIIVLCAMTIDEYLINNVHAYMYI